MNANRFKYIVNLNLFISYQIIPESSQYRIDVEKWYKYIKKTVTSTTDVNIFIMCKILPTSCNSLLPSGVWQVRFAEDEIGLGQLEEVIEIAGDELELIQFYHGELDAVSHALRRRTLFSEISLPPMLFLLTIHHTYIVLS